MKRLLSCFLTLLLLVGCTAELESRMDGFEDRLSKLETLCNQMNTNISSLQTIVTALQNNDFVTNVSPVMSGSVEIGYAISFTRSKPITIYHGKNGKDGTNGTNGEDGKDGINGKDGQTPVIGVKKDSDGLYYWTLNGEWLLDSEGKKIKAIGTDGQNGADGKDGNDGADGQNGADGRNGVTPQLKIVEGYWQISYDNGKTWSQLGKATGNDGQNGADGKDGNDGDSFFQSVDTSNPDYIVFVLADGTRIELPRKTQIIDQIQSIAYVPQYSDRIAYINFPEDGSARNIELDFFISPSSIASTLASSWKSMLHVEAVYNRTKALVNAVPLDILSVQAENGYLKVVASCENLCTDFFAGIYGATACLKVTEGNDTVSSEYIPVSINSSGDLSSTVDLSLAGTANSYIVSSSGKYKFPTMQGNSTTSVGTVASVEVLWETFGTATTPSVGDLVKNVMYSEGYISFEATSKKGNASIAAKDKNGTILWSWHIWMTDQPEEQIYYNDAGIMMDRNLGATTAIPKDARAIGLHYQWGRKDPFLGSAYNISDQAQSASTLIWPKPVYSASGGIIKGTIAYAQANPTTFIIYNLSNFDWYYSRTLPTDNTRWQSTKTKYDPCPPGWRVPDGGPNGIWAKACGSSDTFTDESLYTPTRSGLNFTGKFGDASNIWYPFTSSYYSASGSLTGGGSGGCYWSATPVDGYHNAHNLLFSSSGFVILGGGEYRAAGLSVRCCKE